MSAMELEALEALYANSDDPWRHRHSVYEQAKYAKTLEALARPRYDSILEVGCGNGTLGEQLAQRCDRYVGVDAVERALQAAARQLPSGEFHQRYLPDELPEGPFDLVVLSEVLYFLDQRGIAALIQQITERWSGAEIVSVNYLGPTEQSLQGFDAVLHTVTALPQGWYHRRGTRMAQYRIDTFIQRRESA